MHHYIGKGEIMHRVYSQEELNNIDTDIPSCYFDGKDKSLQVDASKHVINYNNPHQFGRLENMEEVARERGIVLYHTVTLNWKQLETLKDTLDTLKSAELSDEYVKMEVGIIEDLLNIKASDKNK